MAHEDLVAAARRLRSLGLTVLAMRSADRRPAGRWRHLQEEPQGEASFQAMLDALRRGRADRIALVCGRGGLICLDLDADGNAPVAPAAVAALMEALDLPADYLWAGPSGSGRGWHIWLVIPDLPPDTTRFERWPRDAGVFRALEVRAWKHTGTIPVRDGIAGYRGPLPAALPVQRSWSDVCAALDAVCAPLPAPPASPASPTPTLPLAPGDRVAAWARAALEREADDVRRAPIGARNEALNRAAYALGQIVAAGHLAEGEVVRALGDAALAAGLSPAEILPTIRSGLQAGSSHPRSPQERVNGWHPGVTLPGESQGEAPVVEHTTDLGNARRLVRRHGRDVRYVHTWGQWLVWDGRRWARDETGAVHRLARETVRSIYVEAAQAADTATAKALARWAMQSESAGRLAAMVEVARSEEEVAIAHHALDGDPWLLTVRNGTIDLRTGNLRPHRREDLMTRMVNVDYDPDTTCPTWLAFLDRVTGGDQDLQTYLQRAVGYTLSGDTSEQCLFFAHGNGSNGKSTFFGVLSELFGDYGMRIDAESLMLRHQGGGIPNDLARLPGARFVVSSEISGGHRLNEARVKDLTGGDAMVARFLRAEFFQFKPSLTLWMYGNERPRVHGADHGIWRRIRLLPFTVTIPDEERDPQLSTRLLAELPGILAWAVRGCLDWQRHGLPIPAVVRAATDDYRSDMDVIGRFVEEQCIVHPRATVSASALYQAYEAWCAANGEHAVSQTAFGERLNQRGIGKTRTGRGILRTGIGLRAEDATPAVTPERQPTPAVTPAEPTPAVTHAEPAPGGAFMASLTEGLAARGVSVELPVANDLPVVEQARRRLVGVISPKRRLIRCDADGLVDEHNGTHLRWLFPANRERGLRTSPPRTAATVDDLVAHLREDLAYESAD